MVQAAEDRTSDHFPATGRWLGTGVFSSRERWGPMLVVVARVLGQHRLDMPLAQRQYVIQALGGLALGRSGAFLLAAALTMPEPNS